MAKTLIVVMEDADLQSRRCVENLVSSLGESVGEFRIASRGIAGVLGQLSRFRKAARHADVLHAWGETALHLASSTTTQPLIYTPAPTDKPRHVRWLNTIATRRDVRAITLSDSDDREVVCGGFPSNRTTIIHPGVRMPRSIGRDNQIRKRLGLGDDHIVTLAVGESAPFDDHVCALRAISILHGFDQRHCLLIAGRGADSQKLGELNAGWNTDILVNAAKRCADMAYEDLVRAADFGLMTAPGKMSVVPVLACMAGGLPLVAPGTREVGALLEDQHSARLYWPLTPRIAAQRLLETVENPGLCRKIADQARADAYELFSVSRFVSQVGEVYAAASAGK